MKITSTTTATTAARGSCNCNCNCNEAIAPLKWARQIITIAGVRPNPQLPNPPPTPPPTNQTHTHTMSSTLTELRQCNPARIVCLHLIAHKGNKSATTTNNNNYNCNNSGNSYSNSNESLYILLSLPLPLPLSSRTGRRLQRSSSSSLTLQRSVKLNIALDAFFLAPAQHCVCVCVWACVWWWWRLWWWNLEHKFQAITKSGRWHFAHAALARRARSSRRPATTTRNEDKKNDGYIWHLATPTPLAPNHQSASPTRHLPHLAPHSFSFVSISAYVCKCVCVSALSTYHLTCGSDL